MTKRRPRVLFVVNDDWFFVSHRLPLGKALREAGYDVTVAAGQSPAHEKIKAAGLHFEPLPLSSGSRHPVRETRTLAALTGLYRRHRPDVVHHVTIKPVLYGSLVAKALGVKAIINAISGLGYVFIDREKPSAAHLALRAGVTTTYRAALAGERVRVIFQNPDDRAYFTKRGLVDEHRTRMISGSGVDMKRFSKSAVPHGDPLVVLPSRMLWDKGVREFVEAARALRKKHKHARFALVGGADSENPATVPQAQLKQWQAEGLIEWWGHRTDMPDVYAQSSLVVLPSYREGLPLALAEAAATGRACVATDVPGCREVVRHGETGWLVPARDAHGLAHAIDEALSNRHELARRGEAGHHLAATRLSLDSVIEGTLALYRELLGPLAPR